MLDDSHPRFRKSSYSSGRQENCVEVAAQSTGTAVRDSKRPRTGHLAFPPADWVAFLIAVRTEEL